MQESSPAVPVPNKYTSQPFLAIVAKCELKCSAASFVSDVLFLYNQTDVAALDFRPFRP